MKQVQPEKQRGFVLAVVLWSMAALSLITGGIVARINNTLEQAYSMRELSHLEQDIMATEQTLLYVLSARPHNEAGADLGGVTLGDAERSNPFEGAPEAVVDGPTLRFDGTWYSGVGSAGFAIQDAGATISLLEPRRTTWLRAMDLLGVEAAEADRWFDQLMDYQDRDDLVRLNGAEKDQYQEQGLTPPPDTFPVTPHELRNLPIARRYPDVTESLIKSTTTGTGSMVNINTSPSLMLQLVHGIAGEDAESIISERSRHVTRSLAEASSRYGVLFQGGGFETLWQPSGNVRLMLGDAHGRHKRWIEVKFTATANGAPWLIEYSHPVSLKQPTQEPDTTDAFSPTTTSETAPHASDWPYYSAFFPDQLPLE